MQTPTPLTLAVITASRRPLRAELAEVHPESLELQLVVSLEVGEKIEIRPLSARGYNARTLECQVRSCRPQGRGFRVELSTEEPIAKSWLGWRLRTTRAQRKRARINGQNSQVILCSSSVAVESSLVDLGIGGAQVSTNLSVELGGNLKLNLGKVVLEATVVGVRSADEGQFVNLRFTRGQGACRRALSRHILSLSAAA